MTSGIEFLFRKVGQAGHQSGGMGYGITPSNYIDGEIGSSLKLPTCLLYIWPTMFLSWLRKAWRYEKSIREVVWSRKESRPPEASRGVSKITVLYQEQAAFRSGLQKVE